MLENYTPGQGCGNVAEVWLAPDVGLVCGTQARAYGG